jgi:hypothetical protein
VKRALQVLERLLYSDFFSTLAKVINCVRTSLNFKKLKQHYADNISLELAMTAFKKLPQRPLRGRWGTSTAAVDWLLNFDADTQDFPQAFHVVVVPTKAKARSYGDDLNADDGQYNGRWAREAYKGLSEPLFWVAMEAAKATGSPLDHFRHWLQSSPKAADPRPKSVQLAVDAANRIFKRWEEFTEEAFAASTASTLFRKLEEIEDDSSREAATAASATLYLSQACDFFRTVVMPCRLFPWLLAWIPFRPCSTVCDERKRFAADYLNFTEEQINDETSVKIRDWFKEDLKVVAAHGTVPE